MPSEIEAQDPAGGATFPPEAKSSFESSQFSPVNRNSPVDSGLDLLFGNSHKLFDRRVGYLAEDQAMFGWMRVEQMLSFMAPFYPTWDPKWAKQLSDRFEAVDLRHHHINQHQIRDSFLSPPHKLIAI